MNRLSFDPIAFDNIKYLLEGHIYDLDLANELIILDRNEYINQAKWQKEYDITFTTNIESKITSKFILHSKLINIASELLPSSKDAFLSGVHCSIEFNVPSKINELQIERMIGLLKQVYGPNRIYKAFETKELLNNTVQFLFTITFDRLIYENQMDDLYHLAEVSIQTLKKIETITFVE